MMILNGMVKNMTEKMNVRVLIETPVGSYRLPSNEIEDTKTSYQDYVEEVTALLLGSKEGFYNFTDDDGDVVFLMQGTINNSVITVEKY